jgi:hypothetical protein
MRDPLARFVFRDKKPAKPKPPETGSGELAEYLAVDAKDRNKYLQIRTARGIYRAPAYTYLLDVISDGERGEEIALLFSFMVVDIRGKNLQEMAISLIRRECAFIQDYSPHKFANPKPDEAIIESIEITARE